MELLMTIGNSVYEVIYLAFCILFSIGCFFALLEWIGPCKPIGQQFYGSKYYRDENKVYSHKRKRRRDAFGRYRYINEE